jgi:hypothetical protein
MRLIATCVLFLGLGCTRDFDKIVERRQQEHAQRIIEASQPKYRAGRWENIQVPPGSNFKVCAVFETDIIPFLVPRSSSGAVCW